MERKRESIKNQKSNKSKVFPSEMLMVSKFLVNIALMSLEQSQMVN